MAIDVTLLQALLTHLTLPPHIREDLDVAHQALAPELTKLAIGSFRRLQKLTGDKFTVEYENVCANLSASLSLQRDSGYDQDALLEQFVKLRDATSVAFLFVHIPAQNAALLVWKAASKFGDRVIFEAFEASPKSDAVLTSDCLQMDFPGSSVSLEIEEFSKPCFQKNLASFLCRAATETIPRFAEKAYKAGVELVEARGTCDPSLISSMLMIMLSQFGQSMGDQLPLIRKRLHDDCIWTQGASKPWRRSPDYLILRVALRRLLWLHFGDSGVVHVKYAISLMLATLLPQTLGKLDLEQVAYLKSKLARRVAKLAAEPSNNSRESEAQLMKATEASFEAVLRQTVERIANAWETWKLKHRKHVELFRNRRAPRIALELKLYNSWSRMQFILDGFARPPLQLYHQSARTSESAAKGWVSSFRQLIDVYGHQFDKELHLRAGVVQCSRNAPEQACIEISLKIKAFIAVLLDHGHGREHAEALSISLLTLLETWVELDKAAIQLYALLEEYHPGFPDGLMDVLQLRSWEDLSRLQRVHTYLRNRTQKSHRVLSIFDKINPNAYAVCSFDKLERMQELMRKIKKDAMTRENAKLEEWKCLNAEYESLNAKLAEHPNCAMKAQDDWPFDLVHDDNACKKCYHERCINRLWIRVCEHPLPDDDAQAKAVIFELCADEAFCEYRDATFGVLSRIAHCSYSGETREPLLLLSQYEGLKGDLVCYIPRSFGLASKAKKSFHQTHYRSYRLPVDTDMLFVPCGVSYAYYDKGAKTYAAEVSRVSLRHHLAVEIPMQSPLAQVLAAQDYRPGSEGPTSNQVISSQSHCPKSFNVHEFLSVRMLHNGTSRRWYAILQELGSSNINFAADGTVPMLARLIHEVGPAGPVDEEPSTLRLVHAAFKHKSFCDQLLAQIEERMSTLLMNFREHNSMEVVLMLVLRLYCLADEDVAIKARKLILSAREATKGWMCTLRHEMFSSQEASSLSMNLEYALWAALLCRKTFEISLPANSKCLAQPAGINVMLNENELTTFLISSLVIQDSMRHATAEISSNLRSALISDVRLCHSMRSTIRQSLVAYPGALLASLESIWPTAGEISKKCVLEPLPRDIVREPVTAKVHTAGRLQQTLDFHVLDGQVLLDGQPIGRLPECYRSSELLQELVGDQSLYSFASNLPGMAHVLHVSPKGHQIHVGSVNGNIVIRICINGRVFQVLDRKIFYGSSGFDLPHALIEDCVHFLDLTSKVVQCRRKASPWIFSSACWQINLHLRKAWKGHPESPTYLVDVYSFYAGVFSALFRDFERREHLIVQQPTNYPCVVELPRSEMTWLIGKRNLLYCKQLGAEVDPNQDAGTLYGLESAIVVRNELNHSKRSILVPVGNVVVRRHPDTFHVSVKVSGGTGEYVRFDLDQALGRLSCATDFRVLCYLARLHAVTSFVVSDPLTGHTGTEEAMSLLQGPCQPSAPLHPDAVSTLQEIATLTPPRTWYPSDQRSLQMVAWNKECPSVIQHSGYLHMVQQIFGRSNALAPFYGTSRIQLRHTSSPDLDARATIHRSKFLRLDSATTSRQLQDDVAYNTRHAPKDCSEYLGRVMQTLSLWPEQLHATSMLSDLLETNAFSVIGGFTEEYEPMRSIHSALTTEFAIQFGPVAHFCKNRGRNDLWTLAFTLAPFAYRDNVDFDVLEIWLAFAIFDELKALDAPQWPSYAWFHREQHPTADTIVPWLHNAVLVRDENERVALRSSLNRKALHRGLQISENKRVVAIESELQEFAQHLIAQWPTDEPHIDSFEAQYLDLHSAMKSVNPEFKRLYRNLDLSRYAAAVQGILDARRSELSPFTSVLFQSRRHVSWKATGSIVPQLQEHLLVHKFEGSTGHTGAGSEFLKQTPTSSLSKRPMTTNWNTSEEMLELQRLLDSISKQASSVGNKYFDDLKQSLTALQAKTQERRTNQQYVNIAIVGQRVLSSKMHIQNHIVSLHAQLYRHFPASKWLRLGDLWPSMSKIDLLQCLRPTANVSFGTGMKKALVQLGIALSCYQHALRVQDAVMHKDWKRVATELNDGIHQSFSAERYPEWLLLELDANIHIRSSQVEVALASINPPSGMNSVLQMNMGLGKTSVIMPAIAAHLAGQRKSVMRVIVPRSLLSQTSTLLHQRLGRLLGSNVLHVPYSRQTDHSVETTKAFLSIHKQAQKSGSVVLAAPEHILSFKLCGLQALSDGSIENARELVNTQTWLATHSRDLLDESDYLLSPKSGLAFPSGNVSALDGAPFRWTVSQAVLALVESQVPALQADFPSSLEVVPRAGGYPTVYFLRRDAEDHLIMRVTKCLMSGHGNVLNLRGLSRAERILVDKFLSEPIVSREEAKELAYMFRDDPDQTKRLLLLRGLLVQRILLMALKKRFNVQYGIDQRRAPLAVPFIAKGTPTELSEFGHPDVAILLTVLAFYYTGLSFQQLRQSLVNIAKADDPNRVFDSFIQDARVPDSLRDFDSINEDDTFQLTTLWTHIRYSITVVNYFLNNFVFPRHAKQFSVKLQANAFDLPLAAPDLGSVGARSTGFSGTNDVRDLLPSTCPQIELPSLQHTNAMVITYLLALRNRQYEVAQDSVSGRRLTEIGLLRRLKDLKIRTLIDAGAMILELSNADVAKAWLDIDQEASAALYFNSNHEAILRYRQGREVPLIISNVTNLSEVVVYIDESHTRGTDLNLPEDCVGALTLGLSLTKDALMQAAMRLRKLGSTQRVIFFAPLEVHQAILDARPDPRDALVDSSHVIRWNLLSTASSLEALIPLYWSNGANFVKRAQAAWDNWNFLYDKEHEAEFLNTIQEKEKLTLHRLYQPRHGTKIDTDLKDYITAPPLKETLRKLNKLRRNFQDTGTAVNASALEELEQEAQREVEVEVEAETIQERQNPPHYHPEMYHGLNADIKTFIETGRIASMRGVCENAFAALRRSAIGRKYGIRESATRSRLYTSFEFSRTVAFLNDKPNDLMLRAVQAILYFPGNEGLPETALLISQEEMDDCLNWIRQLRAPAARLLLYSAPVTRKMLHFNNLDYCAVPALPQDFRAPLWLTIELGILAGRLYFEFEEYEAIKAFLGISDEDESVEDLDGEDLELSQLGSSSNDGLLRLERRRARLEKVFTPRPIAFMNEYLTALRKDSDISATPMAFVLSGKRLTANHSFFTPRKAADVQKKLSTMHQEVKEQEKDDDVVHEDDLDLILAGEELPDDEFDQAEDDEGEYGARSEASQQTEEEKEKEGEEDGSPIW